MEILRERADLCPTREKLPSLSMGTATHYGVLLVVGGDGPRLAAGIREDLKSLRAGVTTLPGSGLLVKALAVGGRDIELLFRSVRERVLLHWTGRPATPLRTI